MADSQSITLYTSIPPKLYRMAGGIEYGDAYQKDCINSWISGGFRVVSINPRAEIAYLENKYPQVRFVDSGSEDVRARIQVFLRNIAANGESVSGSLMPIATSSVVMQSPTGFELVRRSQSCP